MDDPMPDDIQLGRDIEVASERMGVRIKKHNLKSRFHVLLNATDSTDIYQIYPRFKRVSIYENLNQLMSTVGFMDSVLRCSLDARLLRRILDGKMSWNAAEIGCHIQFYREPNEYDIALHSGLNMFHL